MTRREILEALAELFNEVAGVDAAEVTEDKTVAEDLGIDSLSMVEFVVAAEERFDVEISEEDVDGIDTVADLVSLIEKGAAA